MTEMRWVVSVEEAGKRLDQALSTWAGLSRREVRECLSHGFVEFNGQVAREKLKGRSLTEGDRVALIRPLADLQIPVANEQLELAVLDHGADWIAVDKAAGQGVHPLNSSQVDTVLNALVHLQPNVLGVGEGGLRSGVVHRLDVDTSGVLLFALTEPGFERLRSAFREHLIQKTYRAIVEGRLDDEIGEIELPLRMRRHRPAVVEVAPSLQSQARACRTSWTVLARSETHSLVELQPRTGHLHQLRVTMAHLGAPIVGDAVYGRAEDGRRQMLHAERIRVEEIDVSSPPPADFVACLREMGCG